jgi:[FeFe] hydrogenase H-cluster maturation GTPase HydF
MDITPKGYRKHIGFYGKVNAGKSSIMNALAGQEVSLVSPVKGTTTDPVSKTMELIGVGPVVLIDTAGINDRSELGLKRIEKSMGTMDKVDYGIFIMAADEIEWDSYNEFKRQMKKRKTPYLTIINKIDLLSTEKLSHLKNEKMFKNILFVSTKDDKTINDLREKLITVLQDEDEEDNTIIGDIVPYNGKVILVIPIDSEAPKGRLILPQVHLIRDCLDHGIKSYVVRDSELKGALDDIKDVDLIITDSSIFKEVESIIPRDTKLTSFSILMARQKGDLNILLEGVNSIKRLELVDKPRVLIMESCSHNTSHEDIGTVKIPKLLSNHLKKDVDFTFKMGEDFPKDIKRYDLVIHCGSCMFNRKTMLRRIDICRENNVPITNYGIILAYIAGILDRSSEFLLDYNK